MTESYIESVHLRLLISIESHALTNPIRNRIKMNSAPLSDNPLTEDGTNQWEKTIPIECQHSDSDDDDSVMASLSCLCVGVGGAIACSRDAVRSRCGRDSQFTPTDQPTDGYRRQH